MKNSNFTKPYSIGFIGGGINSAIGYVHRVASEMDGLWEIDAGAFAREADINKQTAESWRVNPEHVYTNWEEMLTKEAGQLDAISVLTPIPSHLEIVYKILELGIPVICEKTLATSKDEISKIRDIYSKKNNFLAVTYNYSGYPIVRELREIIRAGKLGKIQQIQAEMPQEGYSRIDQSGKFITPQKWRLKDYKVPTISLDLGSHLYHLIYFLTGLKPFEVISNHNSYGNFSQIIDDINCWINYPENVRCSLWYSKAALGYRNGLRLRVFGEKGGAEWVQMEPETLKLSWADGTRQILDRGGSEGSVMKLSRYNRFKAGHPAGFIEAFANLYTDIAHALEQFKQVGKHKSDFVFGIEHAEDELNFFEAAVRSNHSRKWESIGY